MGKIRRGKPRIGIPMLKMKGIKIDVNILLPDLLLATLGYAVC